MVLVVSLGKSRQAAIINFLGNLCIRLGKKLTAKCNIVSILCGSTMPLSFRNCTLSACVLKLDALLDQYMWSSSGLVTRHLSLNIQVRGGSNGIQAHLPTSLTT